MKPYDVIANLARCSGWIALVALSAALPVTGAASEAPGSAATRPAACSQADEDPAGSVLDQVSSAPVSEPADRVLAEGDPALTRGMVDRVHRFFEWVLDAPLNVEQRKAFQDAVVSIWKKQDGEQMATVLQLLKISDKIMALSEEQRELLRAKAQPELLGQWRAQTQDATARWALAIYDAAHEPIAPGDPPLTRQMTDAYAELIAFMAREVTGKPFEADVAFKENAKQAFIQMYGRMPDQARKQVAQLPYVWAALRAAWPKVPESERATLRQQWAAVLRQLIPQTPETTAAEKSMQALQQVSRRVEQGQKLNPDEMQGVAGHMETVAKALRQQGGEQNAAKAAEFEQAARAYRAAAQQASANAARANASAAKTTSQQAYDRLTAMRMQQHNNFVTLYNASLIRHAGTMNMISIMGGSPYRYSVR